MTATSDRQHEHMRRRPALVRWFADRPRIADVFVMLACTIPTVVALVIAPPTSAWLGYACAAGIAVAFWWRRTHPLIVLLVVVALATLTPLSGDVAPAYIESAFALYALAAHTRLRVAVGGYLLSQAVIFAVSGATILLGFRDGWAVVLAQPVPLVALAIGIAVRQNRARRAALEEMIVLRESRAAAAERARITAEMHDVVAHSVTVMIALAGGAAAGWERHPERALHALDQLGTVGAHALEEMQRILRVLREHDQDLDRSLESSGFNVPSLEQLVDVFRAAGLPAVLAGSSVQFADPALQTTVYRIVQESLTNALRHAHDATHVEVDVSQNDECLTVTVTDNGRGTRRGPSPGAGVGLRAMRERAAAFHGELIAGPIPSDDHAPGTGWRTRVSIPLNGQLA